MSVNTMAIEQAYSLIQSIHNQVTGNNSLAPVDTSSFISVAQETLMAGYDSVIQSITQVVSKTLIAVRPYQRKFKGLEVTTERWGGIIRKINFLDIGPEPDPTYGLGNLTTVDQFEVQNPQIIETRYVGSNVYMGHYTIYTKQLDEAFSSPEKFGEFMSGLMTHFSNEREQWLEDNSRAILMNLITAKEDLGIDVIHLLSEYNAATGLSLTSTTVRQPANFPAFCKWAYARVAQVSSLMTERSVKYQIPGPYINRHTPVEDQKVYFNADFLQHMTAEVLADTYHDNFLRLADVEGVNFWQSIDYPLDIADKPVYIDGTGTVVVAAAGVVMNNVLGVIFDRDACGYNIFDESLETSPYNAAGQYYNIFSHVRVQDQNDLTEKVAVFCLD